ncbi:hypothetical protein ES707_19538 [subsurface metagenome]
MPIYTIRVEDDIYVRPAHWALARGSGGELYSIYSYASPPAPDKIGVSISLDDGITWGVLFELTDPIDDLRRVSLAIDSTDKLHLTYERWTGANTEAKYRSYSATGVLSAELDLSPGPGNSGVTEVVVDGTDTAHVIYIWVTQPRHITIVNDAIVLDEIIPGFGALGVSHMKAAIDSDNNVHVACIERTSWQANYICRTVGWGGIEVLSVGVLRKAHPAIVLDRNNNIHVAWCNNPPDGGVYYRDKTNGIWGGTQTLSTWCSLPIVAANNNDVITVIFRSMVVPFRMYYRQFIGGAWSSPLRLTSYTNSESYGTFLWAMWPQIGGVRTNVLTTGYAFVFRIVSAPPGAEELKYFASSDLSWIVAPPIVINKSYALSREEL